MSPNSKFIIITSINDISSGVKKFLQFNDWKLVLVQDKKSPAIENTYKNLELFSIDKQQQSNLQLYNKCPFNHYSRKNLGYLLAMKNGAEIIYDTDDDNIPYDNWHLPEFKNDNLISSNNKFINIYKFYTDEFIWPRGLPLDEIHIDDNGHLIKGSKSLAIGAWQGLADTDPDVDAIYRLIVNKEVKFTGNDKIVINKGVYTPFNSQNTFWHRDCFVLLYLPSTVSFRFTDIFRSYITQRIMWHHDKYLGFTGATVWQARNEHNLMNDFSSEIDCYLSIKKVVDILDNIKFVNNNMIDNIIQAYSELSDNNIVDSSELDILSSWCEDYKKVNNL